MTSVEIVQEKMRINNLIATHRYYTKSSDLAKYGSKVILTGGTSAGKSTIANRIINCNILPSGRGVVTRVPQLVSTDKMEEGQRPFEVVYTTGNDQKNVSVEYFEDEAGVHTHLQTIFSKYPKVNYDDHVTIKKFVNDPSFIHVLDVPGSGVLDEVIDIMQVEPKPINVTVVGFKVDTVKLEDGIFSGIMYKKSKTEEMIILGVLNRIDVAVESKECAKKGKDDPDCNASKRCEACTEHFLDFSNVAASMHDWCNTYGKTHFLVQSCSVSSRFTEEENARYIIGRWERDEKCKDMASSWLLGISELQNEIRRLSTEKVDSRRYGEIINAIRAENVSEEMSITRMETKHNDLAHSLYDRFRFGFDIIRRIESKFIEANQKLTFDISKKVSYQEDILSQDNRTHYGDRHAIEAIKRMMASDKVVDKTLLLLSDEAHIMTHLILDSFEEELKVMIKNIQSKDDNNSELILKHWDQYRTDNSHRLEDIIRDIFIASKHIREMPFDYERENKKMQKRVEKIQKELENATSSAEKKSLLSMFTNYCSALVPIYPTTTKGSAKVDPTFSDSYEGDEKDLELAKATDLEDIKDEKLMKLARYVSFYSRFYRRKVYKQAREDLEMCMSYATKFVFMHVSEDLIKKYPARMISSMTVLDEQSMTEKEAKIKEMRDAIEHRNKTCADIRRLVSKM